MTQFDFFSITSAGGRATNMDAIRQAESHGVACWVVADGLGGHSHSEVASKVAVDAVINGFISSEAAISVEYIDGLVQLANKAVLEAKASRQELRTIATTLVVLLSDGQRAVWAHVGDSRLYLLRAGQVATHTRDHSLSQAMAGVTGDDVGEPTSNALILALGMRQTVKPRVSEVLRLCRDDAFILCVDGFWEKVLPLEMEVDFAKARSAKEWLRFLERRVCARQKEGSDNYTAWAVRFSDPKLPAPTLVAPTLPLGQPNQSNPPPVEALPLDAKDVAIGDGNGAAKRARSIGATVGITAGLLLSWAVVAGGGFYVGRHQGTADQNAAGKVDARNAVNQVNALTTEDECLLAWAKIEKSRDPDKYKNFMTSSTTRGCKQADAARNYEAEVQAWRAGVGKSPQAIAAHVLKFHDSGSFPAQLQLAELVAKAETPPDNLCINVAKLWKDLTKRQLIWDDMPSVIAISRQAKDGNCNPTFNESQKSIASLFEDQRASLASSAKGNRDFTPQVLSKVLNLVDQARGKERTDPQAAYRAYQEARTEMNAFNAAAAIAQEEARKKREREREKELAREENAAAERKEKEAQEARKAQEEAAKRKRSEALAKDEKAAVERKASEAATEAARKAREESVRRQQDEETRAKVLKDMAAEKAADDARKAQEAAKKKEQDDARRRKEEEGG